MLNKAFLVLYLPMITNVFINSIIENLHLLVSI